MSGGIDRIVVALDAVSENRAAIAAAARLAARWHAPLHGVFVEDEDLFRLANLPFARQVMFGGRVEPFDLQQATRQTRVFIERARRQLAAAAARRGIEWSFEIAHGASSGGVATASGDFLVTGTTTRSIAGHFRMEGRWFSMAEDGPLTRLLAHHEGDAHGVVAALLRGQGPESERLLDAAIRLAEAHDARLTVICPSMLAQAPGFQAWLDRRLADHTVEAELELLPEPAALHRRIIELSCRLVAVEATADEARPERLREMVATIACDILVVR